MSFRPSATHAWALSLVALTLATGAGDPVVAAVSKTITGKQVKNGSIQVKDLSKKARASLRGPAGKRGTPGAPGAPGAQGVPGAPGANGAGGAPGDDLNGQAAGGDLTGTYPNPTVAPGAVGPADLDSTGVAQRSMLGADGWVQLDGTFARMPAHTTIVPAAGTAAANGTALLAAAAAAPSGTIVQLDAGSFDIGTATLTVPAGVTLAGAGRQATVITAAPPLVDLNDGSAVITGADTEIRDLRLKAVVARTAAAITTSGGTVLRQMAIEGSAPAGGILGISAVDAAGTVTAHDVTMDVSGSVFALGFSGAGASTTFSIVGGRFRSTGSVAATSGSMTISGATLSGRLSVVSGGTMRIVHSQVDATTVSNSGTLTCAQSYTATLTPVGAGCT